MEVKWISFMDKWRWKKPILTFFALIFIIISSNYLLSQKIITLAVNGQTKKVLTRASTVSNLLDLERIPYTPHDEVKPSLSQKLLPGMKVEVNHATPVFVNINEEQQIVMPVAKDVGEVVLKLGINPHSDMRIYPQSNRPLIAGMLIDIKLLNRKLETVQSPVSYETKRQDDPTLPRGRTRLAVKGQPGVREQVIEVVYAGKDEIERNVKSDTIAKAPVTEVVKVGTKVPRIALAPPSAPPDPADPGIPVSRGERTMTMNATAYASGDGGGAGWRTATGTGVYKGIVAVDPRVIPLGTRLYIEGYGPAVAADTGGAIKGNRVDLGFSSVAEARNFGRRNVVVHILN